MSKETLRKEAPPSGFHQVKKRKGYLVLSSMCIVYLDNKNSCTFCGNGESIWKSKNNSIARLSKMHARIIFLGRVPAISKESTLHGQKTVRK